MAVCRFVYEGGTWKPLDGHSCTVTSSVTAPPGTVVDFDCDTNRVVKIYAPDGTEKHIS